MNIISDYAILKYRCHVNSLIVHVLIDSRIFELRLWRRAVSELATGQNKTYLSVRQYGEAPHQTRRREPVSLRDDDRGPALRAHRAAGQTTER